MEGVFFVFEFWVLKKTPSFCVYKNVSTFPHGGCKGLKPKKTPNQTKRQEGTENSSGKLGSGVPSLAAPKLIL